MSQTPSSSESHGSLGHGSASDASSAASHSTDASAAPIDEEAWWYNMRTGAVEHGKVSGAGDRVGPFTTQEAASHALDTLRENSARWAAEEAADN